MTSSDEQHSQDDEVFTQIQPQITTVTNTNAKFPYLKKGEYDIWAMKMQNFITNSDLPCWNIVLNGNSHKKHSRKSNRHYNKNEVWGREKIKVDIVDPKLHKEAYKQGHFARECRAKGSQDSQRYSAYKTQNAGKKTDDSQALISVDTFINWQDHEECSVDEGGGRDWEGGGSALKI
ncbi:hypothetical protein Tco_0206806 [Tanacetum coccineum]